MPKIAGINHQQAVNAFKKAGFWIARQGKHITMTNGECIITIPRANPILIQATPIRELIEEKVE